MAKRIGSRVGAFLVAAAILATLVGCFASSGGGESRVQEPRYEAEPRYSSVKGVSVNPQRADVVARDAFQLVNEERMRRGLLPLSRRGDLDGIALDHARDLFQMNQLSHISSDGRRLEHRMGRVNWSRAGENLARNKGFESPSREAVRGWIASPRHYENMFRGDFSQTGLAALYDPASGFTYIVQVFVVPA